MSKLNDGFVAEVIGPGTLIKDGTTLIRRISWPGGRGSIIVAGYTPSINPTTNFTCTLANDFIAKNTGGISDPAIGNVNDNGVWPFDLPVGEMTFNIAPAGGNDLAFTDGIYVVGSPPLSNQ